MEKVYLTLFIKNKRRALFKCEIVDDVENVIKDLEAKLNNKDLDVVRFGQVGFNRSDFEHFEISHK